MYSRVLGVALYRRVTYRYRGCDWEAMASFARAYLGLLDISESDVVSIASNSAQNKIE